MRPLPSTLCRLQPVIYNPFAARLASFPNDISRDDLDGAEIHKATGADLLGLALAGVTVRAAAAGRRRSRRCWPTCGAAGCAAGFPAVHEQVRVQQLTEAPRVLARR